MKKQIAVFTLVGLVAISNSYSQPIPGGVTNAGMTYIVEDTPVWYNINHLPGKPFAGYVTNGPIVPLTDQLSTKTALPTGSGNYGNWEPYTSVVGDHTFLVGCGIFADDGSWNSSTNLIGSAANQRYVLTKQPAAGGPPKHDEYFYDDFGNPYSWHQILRQRTPGARVGGDKRYGAKNFMTGGTAALHYGKHWFGIDYFNTDGRHNTDWPLFAASFPSDCNNNCASGNGTWDTHWTYVQPFSLDPATLVQTPLTNAYEAVFSPTMRSNTATANKIDVAVFGGTVGALSDGNFVINVNEFTGFWGGNTANDNSVVKIVRPDGTTVKDTWYLPGLAGFAQGSWGEFAAFRGGFAIKVQGSLYFYQNDGTPIATNVNWYNNPGNDGIYWQGFDRGDDMRMVSDPRSDYVYIAGRLMTGGTVLNSSMGLGIWDGRTGAFVTNCIVNNDLDLGSVSLNSTRASTAVDALNRVCVAYDGRPASGYANQVMARVMQFDGTNVTFLTPTFFPFINSDNTNNVVANGIMGFTSVKPNVSMTTRAICFAATALINATNNPAEGPNAGPETTVYTVISHPVPMVPPRPQITVTKSGNDAIIAWDADAGLFTLQSRSAVASGSWADVSPQPAMVPATGNRYTKTVTIGSDPLFFRLAR